VVTPIHPFWP